MSGSSRTDASPPALAVGPYRLRAVLTGTFRLDGGAMFGSVPKTLWQKRAPADELNRIELATRSLWIEDPAGGRRVLVDAGNGDKFDAKTREIFAVETVPPEAWRVPAGEVTDVIATHLHFDHAGGLTRRRQDGTLELTFPDAVIHLQRANLENARAPTERERASYLRENVEPLAAATLDLLDGDGEILPSIRAVVFDGHTRGLQGLVVGSGRGAVAYPADLIPTASHLHLPWIMGYDRCAETTLEEKRRFLEEAVEEEWIVVFEHDPRIAAATVARDDRGRFVIGEVVEL